LPDPKQKRHHNVVSFLFAPATAHSPGRFSQVRKYLAGTVKNYVQMVPSRIMRKLV